MKPSIDKATPQPVNLESGPLCPLHRRMDNADNLECEIGNNCVACSLNERMELLRLLEPFAAEGNVEDSITVMRRVCGFHSADVAGWAQAVLTALNVGDVQKGSKLHLKLREVMMAYRGGTLGELNDDQQG